MATIKETVLEFITKLPDDITMEDLMYHLYAKQKILRGKRQMAEKKVKNHEEIEVLAKQWHV
jgi:hypothetical protein